MKAKQMFEMTNEELIIKNNSLKQELFNLRFSQASNQLTNTSQLNTMRKDIAKIKTVLRQRELNISVEPVKTAPVKKTRSKAKKED